MRVLILGGAGMLGHKLWQTFHQRFDTWVSVRSTYPSYRHLELFDEKKMLSGVDGLEIDALATAIAKVRPDVVVNCIGVIKQLPTAQDPIISLSINSLLPHHLANLCQSYETRLIHISTDCVFSGRKGNYTEEDVSDADDLYGRTKFLGEVGNEGCLTLRTSIIGRELSTSSGIVEWFLSQGGKSVSGYTHAVFSGFTTLALGRIISNVIEEYPQLSGVYQVSSDPVTKFDLLMGLRNAFNVPVEIEPRSDITIDRTLNSNRFRQATGFAPEPWTVMLEEMAQDPTPYDKWRTNS
jgi:dTDP-4-dehydrorhamnose reductase